MEEEQEVSFPTLPFHSHFPFALHQFPALPGLSSGGPGPGLPPVPAPPTVARRMMAPTMTAVAPVMSQVRVRLSDLFSTSISPARGMDTRWLSV